MQRHLECWDFLGPCLSCLDLLRDQCGNISAEEKTLTRIGISPFIIILFCESPAEGWGWAHTSSMCKCVFHLALYLYAYCVTTQCGLPTTWTSGNIGRCVMTEVSLAKISHYTVYLSYIQYDIVLHVHSPSAILDTHKLADHSSEAPEMEAQ